MRYLNQIKRDFENLSMRNKLLAVVLSNVVLILLVALMELRISSSVYNEQLYKAIAGNLSFSSRTISGNLESIETLSFVIISFSVIQDSLNHIDSTDDPLIWSDSNPRISVAINNYQQAYKNNGVAAIALNNRYSQNLTNFVVINNADTDTIRDAVDKIREWEGAITWTIDYDHGLHVLSCSVRKVYNLEPDHLGGLLVSADLDRIVRDANRVVTTYGGSGYILLDGDQLIHTSDGINPETADGFMKQTGQPYSIVYRNGHSYSAAKNTIPCYNWTYINLVSCDQISSSTGMIYRLILTMLIVGSIAAMIFSRRLTRYTLKDFDLSTQKMEFFSSTELKMSGVEVDYSKRTDEISRLHQHFDITASRIQYLVQNSYVNQILNRDTKLKALKSQINSHFLYNILGTINWRVKALKDQQIPSMVESLGTLLRATFSSKKPLVTLDYEIGLAGSYMTIQKIRLEDRFLFHVECLRELGEVLILPLTIQPLLEDAIRCGTEEMMDTCEISIRTMKGGGLLIMEVLNEGSVFEDGLPGKLQDGTKNTHGFGIGLVNIHQHIQMLSGEAYGLSFKNENEEAIAIITAPYKTEEDDYA